MAQKIVEIKMLATGQVYHVDPEAADALISAGEAEFAKPEKREATSRQAAHRETR